MIENLTKAAGGSRERSHYSVLIAGGFHTPEMASLLKKGNVSYIVLSPRITKIDGTSGTSYLSRRRSTWATKDYSFGFGRAFGSPCLEFEPSRSAGAARLTTRRSSQEKRRRKTRSAFILRAALSPRIHFFFPLHYRPAQAESCSG